MDRQSELLAAEAVRLAKTHSILGDENLGLYCILDIPHHDPEVARLFSRDGSSLYERFAREVRPTRVLQQMPVIQAFWAALDTGARGPVRVFAQSEFAEKNAAEQADLDLRDGACRVAMILNVRMLPEQVSGKVIWPGR
jgi:hypothetical protein